MAECLVGEPAQSVDRFPPAGPWSHEGAPDASICCLPKRVDIGLHAHCDLDRPGSAGLGSHQCNSGSGFWDLLHSVVHRDPPVAHQSGTPKRCRPVAPDVDGRPWRLKRLGLEHDWSEIEVLTVVLDDRIGPQPLANRDGFVHALAAVSEIETDRIPFSFEPTRPDPELRATTGDDVERGHSTGYDKGMPKADVVDVSSEPDLLCAARQEGEICESVEDVNVRWDRRVFLSGIGTPV
jgi:hypothetical protein